MQVFTTLRGTSQPSAPADADFHREVIPISSPPRPRQIFTERYPALFPALPHADLHREVQERRLGHPELCGGRRYAVLSLITMLGESHLSRSSLCSVGLTCLAHRSARWVSSAARPRALKCGIGTKQGWGLQEDRPLCAMGLHWKCGDGRKARSGRSAHRQPCICS
eukprot:360468-Chlamydomonas_euryale.AAC.2